MPDKQLRFLLSWLSVESKRASQLFTKKNVCAMKTLVFARACACYMLKTSSPRVPRGLSGRLEVNMFFKLFCVPQMGQIMLKIWKTTVMVVLNLENNALKKNLF